MQLHFEPLLEVFPRVLLGQNAASDRLGQHVEEGDRRGQTARCQQGARPAQEVPAEVMAHAIPMEVEDVQLATVQMVQMPNGGQDVAAKKVSGISI